MLEQVVDQLRDELGVTTVHLTGGEPSLHPAITEFVTNLRQRGFTVRMTSNGTFRPSLLAQLADAGLSSLNVSVLALNPESLATLQTGTKTEEWAKRQIARATSNLIQAKESQINVTINCTISAENDDWRGVFEFARRHGIVVRFQNDLYSAAAVGALQQIIRETSGRLIEVKTKNLTSRVTYTFRTPSGYLFSVKAILPVTLNSMCGNCQYRNQCKEWFYTVRLEQGMPVNVRLCLHRNDSHVVMSAEEFLMSKHFQLLKALVCGQLSAKQSRHNETVLAAASGRGSFAYA